MKTAIGSLILIFAYCSHGMAQVCYEDWGIRNCPAIGTVSCANPLNGQCSGKATQGTGENGNFVTPWVPALGGDGYALELSFPVICSVEANCIPEHDLNGNVVGCTADLLSLAPKNDFIGGYVNYDLPCIPEEPDVEEPEEPEPLPEFPPYPF